MKPVKSNSSQLSAAFFDVDDTLITVKSMFDFFEYLSEKKQLTLLKFKFEQTFKQARANDWPREALNSLYYQFLSGMKMSELIVLGECWFDDNVLTKGKFISKTIKCLRKHQSRGEKIIFVSGSMLPLLNPIARYFQVDGILCVQPIVDVQGFLTGKIKGIQTIGEGKAKAIRKFALKEKIDLSMSYGYGDDISDLNMLSCVGNPVYVGNNSTMLNHAKYHNWSVL